MRSFPETDIDPMYLCMHVCTPETALTLVGLFLGISTTEIK